MEEISTQRETLPNCDDNKADSLITKALIQAIKSARRHVLHKMLFDNIDIINQYGISEEDWNKYIVSSEIGSILSVDVIMLLTKYFVSKRLKDKSYKNTLSDGGDILHASYAKYCDIMRIDKRTYNLFQEIQRDVPVVRTKFVKNLEDLPEVTAVRLG
jgi:hypothetical protein